MSFTTSATDNGLAAYCGDEVEAEAALPSAALAHAVVGLGRFGSTHARKLGSLPGFRLCAVVDSSPAARPVADLAALPLLSGIGELPPDIESATVATSDGTHAELAMALMRRGCHVLVEKPLCIDRQDGALMLRTAQECGVILSTGHIERFNPAFNAAELAWIRHAARRHQHSAHPFLRFRRFSCRESSALDSVLDLMVHDLDLLAWLCAIPVDAPLQVISRQIDARSARVRVRLGGLVAELESGYGSMPPAARLQVCNSGRQHVLDLRKPHRAVAGGGGDALARQYQDFRRAVQGNRTRIASGADGLAAVTRASQVLHA
ncbi:putative dehydrogenase [Variovorax paradoxus]|uniref:Gfo/Idh/MocA family protein n=1 Tax=Variovorax paradoxus TaxID=34073 RepID=UPI0033956235